MRRERREMMYSEVEVSFAQLRLNFIVSTKTVISNEEEMALASAGGF
jgi:hypothetical protein